MCAKTTTTAPRIAVCFFGITRSLPDTIGSIEANVLAAARARGQVTVFTHLYALDRLENPRSGESGAIDADEYPLLQSDWLRREPPGAALRRWEFEALKAHGDRWGDDYRSLANLVHQLHSLRETTCAALEIDPDLCLFLRPDLRYHDDLSDRIDHALNGRGPLALVPSWQGWRGLNDRFAICRGRRAIAAYGRRIELAGRFCQVMHTPLHAERLLSYALRRGMVPVGRFDHRASRMRLGGRMQDEAFTPEPAHLERRYLIDSYLRALGRRSGVTPTIKRWYGSGA